MAIPLEDLKKRIKDTVTMGCRVKVTWRHPGGDAEVWEGRVVSIKPDQMGCVIDYVGHGEFELPGHNIEVLTLETLGAPALGSTPNTTFLPHDPCTWVLYIKPDGDQTIARDMLAIKLCEHFGCQTREKLAMSPGADFAAFDAAAHMETVMAWVKCAQSLNAWTSAPFVAIVRPALIRLTDHRMRAVGGPGAVRAFRTSLDEELARKDPVSRAAAKALRPSALDLDPQSTPRPARGRGRGGR